MILGERLKKLREGKYSQEKLAELLHVHNNTISKWENGTQEPRAKRVQELAHLLGTTTAYLLGETDNSIPVVQQNIPFSNVDIHPRGTVSSTFQQSSKSGKSTNNGMLIYESSNGDRFEAPATEIGIEYLERMCKVAKL